MTTHREVMNTTMYDCDMRGPCIACGRPAVLVPALGRQFHLNGSENDGCWLVILRGQETGSISLERDRRGYPHLVIEPRRTGGDEMTAASPPRRAARGRTGTGAPDVAEVKTAAAYGRRGDDGEEWIKSTRRSLAPAATTRLGDNRT